MATRFKQSGSFVRPLTELDCLFSRDISTAKEDMSRYISTITRACATLESISIGCYCEIIQSDVFSSLGTGDDIINPFESSYVNDLIQAIGSCTNLRSVDACCCCVLRDDLFRDTLQRCKKLTTLKLATKCNCYNPDRSNILRFLILPIPTLTTICFYGIRIQDTDYTANAMTEFIRRCPALHTLKLESCYLNHHAATSILKACANLSILSFCGNNITMFSSFAETLLERCNNLETLDLSHSYLNGEDMVSFVNILPELPKLKSLLLSYCCMNANPLSTVLPKCVSLTDLDISGNWIFDSGAKELVSVLPQCRSLQTVFMNECNFNKSWINVLAEALPSFEQPEELRFYLHWTPARHSTFGNELNQLFSSFLLGIGKYCILKEEEVVPDTLQNRDKVKINSSMVEQTLEVLQKFGMTTRTFEQLVRAAEKESTRQLKRKIMLPDNTSAPEEKRDNKSKLSFPKFK